jgi:hypothetical protein
MSKVVNEKMKGTISCNPFHLLEIDELDTMANSVGVDISAMSKVVNSRHVVDIDDICSKVFLDQQRSFPSSILLKRSRIEFRKLKQKTGKGKSKTKINQDFP